MVYSEMDGEIVMMSIENSEYYGLDPVASSIWKALAEPLTLGELVDRLLEEYEVDRNTCMADVEGFVQELLDKKVLLRADHAG
jgi:hypothetical protein